MYSKTLLRWKVLSFLTGWYTPCYKIKHYDVIAQLHTSLKEFIRVLIAVMSWLDAVVACINVLNPMENRRFAVFKLKLLIKYTGYVSFTNNNRKVIKFLALWRLLEVNCNYWMWVTTKSILVFWWKWLKTKAIRLVTVI